MTRRRFSALRSRAGSAIIAARRSAVLFAAAIVTRSPCALAGIENVLRRRQPRAIKPCQRRGDVLGRTLGEQRPRQRQIVVGGLLREQRIPQHALLIELANFIRGRSCAPDRIDAGQIQQQFRAPLSCHSHQQYADALAARTSSAARTMLHHLGVVRQICVNDEIQIGQVNAARCNVGGDADAGAAVAQCLQRLGPLVLRQFARQRDHGEAALQQRRLQMPDGIPGVAEHQRAGRFKESQHVDDRMLDIPGGDPYRPVLDIGVTTLVARDFDAKGLSLILLCQCDDAARQGCGEQ